MCNKEDPTECIPHTDIPANQREAEYDEFCKNLVGYTARGTDTSVLFEIAWQLKRISDKLNE